GNGVAAGVAHTGLPQHCADHRDGLLGGEVDRGLSTVHDLRVDDATGGPGPSGRQLPPYLAGLIGAEYQAADPLHVVAGDPHAHPAVEIGEAVEAVDAPGDQVERHILVDAPAMAVHHQRPRGVAGQPEPGALVLERQAVDEHRVVRTGEVD